MVTKVSGKANGIEISFEWVSGDRWEAIVPANLEGEYAVELYAHDDTGNVTYACTMLFAISGHELQGYVVPRGFAAAGAKMADYTGYPTIFDFLAGFRKNTYRVDQVSSVTYKAELEKGGYTIERAVCKRDTG